MCIRDRNGNALSFSILAGAGSNGLEALVPMISASGVLTSITRNGSSIPFVADSIKGVAYGRFSATTGSYVATYAADVTAPTVASQSPAGGATGVSVTTVVTTTFSDCLLYTSRCV